MRAVTVQCGKRLAVGFVGLVSACFPAQAQSSATAEADTVWIGRFGDAGASAAWREVLVNPKLTPNRFTRRPWDGVAALEVHSQRSISLYARPVQIDLARTPVLCWRWRVDAPLVGADMATRAGDDYAARLYVSLGIPLSDQSFALRAQLRLARSIWGPDVPDAALNYVWDNRQPIGTVRPNAYTARAQMVVLRSGSADAGRWVWERRNVAQDAAAAFGASATPVQVAVTADTDNTGESAHAGFADLHFVAADRRCEE